MMSFSDRYNTWHYELWEKRGAKVWKRVRRTLQAWRARLTRWREDRASMAEARRKTEDYDVIQQAGIQRQALVRAMLENVDEDFLQAVKEKVRGELIEQARAECLAQVREEHQETLERELGKTRDALAKQKDLLAGELEDELDRRLEKIRQEVRDEYDERLETLRERLQEARTTGERASVLLISFVKQLLSRKRTYLYDAHVEELDLRELNEFLAGHHLHVRGEYRHSERQVKCRLKNGWAQRTVFTLEAAGASEPDEQEDAGALALPEASADGEASTS